MGLGISLGAFLITREESAWILPILLFLLIISVTRVFQDRLERKWIRGLIILAPILLGFIPQQVISGINYSHYGFWGVSENLDKNFNRVLIALGRIKTDEWYPYSQVTKEGVEKAFQVSPLLAVYQTTMEQQWENWVGISTIDLESRPEWYFEKYQIKTGELGMYFNWFFREILAYYGEFENGYPD